jgi:hypothetical protein
MTQKHCKSTEKLSEKKILQVTRKFSELNEFSICPTKHINMNIFCTVGKFLCIAVERFLNFLNSFDFFCKLESKYSRLPIYDTPSGPAKVCLISGANLKDFLIIWAKNPVSYIGVVLYRKSTASD